MKVKALFYVLVLFSVPLLFYIGYVEFDEENFVFEEFVGNRSGRKEVTTKVPEVTCPNGTVLIAVEGGRTGNLIWEYMSLLAVTHYYPERRFRPYVMEEIKRPLEEIFEPLSIPSLSNLSPKCRNRTPEYVIEITDPPSVIRAMRYDVKTVTLGTWSSRYEEVLGYGMQNVRREMRFKRGDLGEAKATFDRLKMELNIAKDKRVTFVGLHYRGDDYTYFLKNNFKDFKGPPTYRYYSKAMSYFEERYSDVVFVLITIDWKWAMRNVPFLRPRTKWFVYLNESRTTLQDLVLLSKCDHTVISYGTFATFAALMAGGTTIAYDLGVALNRRGMTLAMGVASLHDDWLLCSD